MALMAKNEKNPEQKEWGKAIKPLFTTPDRGSHVNIGMTKHAPNKANALKLMGSGVREAQRIALANNEYPVN
jgi:iron(III) transport system substrate-binding protein